MKINSGFTLLEMVVVMTIAAILIAIGAPSFRYVTNANRMSSEVNGLLGDMTYARAEAIKEGQKVTVCSSTDGATCRTANGTVWKDGWIVFSDINGNGTADATEPVLRIQRAFGGSDTFTSDNSISAVTFNREGFALGLPALVTVTLHDATSNSKWTRCLTISTVGQVKTQQAGGSCQ